MQLERRAIWLMLVALAVGLLASGGCSLWRSDQEKAEKKRLDAMLNAPAPPELVRQAAGSFGLAPMRIQSYGIVNNLLGTGSIEPPGLQRDQLLNQMKVINVEDPNKFIDSSSTAVVLVETWIPAGARKGDPLDLTVRVSQRPNPNGESTTSLRNGWLMPAPLRFTQVIGGVPRTSDVLAEGTGPVLLRVNYESGDDPQLLLEGRVLAGGRVIKENPLELRIREEYRHVSIAKKLQDAINRRFYYFDGTSRRGIANAKQDDLIVIEVPERYRNNANRLMAVVGAMGTESDLSVTNDRIAKLTALLSEPTTAQDAALQLEAIGQPGVPALLNMLGSPNAELRYYAAEALAFLDNDEAIQPLVDLSREQRAFRYQTLGALAEMKNRRAGDGLRQLFDESSLETRFGAFDAMKRRADRNTFISGRRLADVAMYYEIPSKGGPMLGLSLRRSPDIVEFGGPIPVHLPPYLMCGTGLTIVPDATGGIQINRILTGRPNQRVVVPPTAAALCVGIVQVGGSYGDIVETLRLLAEQKALGGQLAIDLLPEPFREYQRENESSSQDSLDTAALMPEPVDPKVSEKKHGWYDPRGWF